MHIPDRDDYDRLDEWVTEVADGMEVSEQIIWEIVEELKSGASAITKDKTTLLRRLLEHHTVYMNAQISEQGQPDLNCKIQLFGGETPVYEYQYPSHNVIDLNSSQKEELSEIIAEENMTKQSEGERYLAAFLPENDLDEEVRIINRILQEVHNVSIDEIGKAIEVRGKKRYSWTDEQELKENIQQISADGPHRNQDSQEQRSTTEVTKPTKEEKEYDEWIFCQECGERITSPDENPRFCSDCRE